MRMIFGVVWCGISNEYCGSDVKCFCGGIHYVYYLTWNGLCWSCGGYDSYIYVGWDCVPDLLCLYLSWRWHLEVDLVQCLVL